MGALLIRLYPWTKALHLMAVIAWLSGLFYLPRLFVYHCAVAPGSAEGERFKVMERRLLKQIVVPAMCAAWALGLALAFTPGVVDWRHDGWWHVKLASVLLLSGFTGAMSKWRRQFRDDCNTRTARFYRIANEVPTLLMAVIVVMVIVKPF